jgi:hypothetical protein
MKYALSMPMCRYVNNVIEFQSLVLNHKLSFMVLFFDLQKQSNHSDCGLFAIANAMALCNGQTPEYLSYDLKIMRQHLAGCLEDKIFRHFPARKRTITQETKKTEKINVYCSCRLPEGAHGGRMIACDGCGEWYHEECIDIPSSVWTDPSNKWICHLCI